METGKEGQGVQAANYASHNSNKPLSPMEEAKKIKEELKEQNDRKEALLEREEKLNAERLLSGDSGGHVAPEPQKPVSNKEYYKEVKEKINRGDFTHG